MKGLFKTTMLALASASLLADATAASAGPFQAAHPRRAEVNARLANQSRRITHERREGELTRVQARELRAEDRGVRGQERFLASRQGGRITRMQKRRLNREETGIRRRIGR